MILETERLVLRKSVTASGDINPPTIKNFEIGDIKPHITFAPNIEA